MLPLRGLPNAISLGEGGWFTDGWSLAELCDTKGPMRIVLLAIEKFVRKKEDSSLSPPLKESGCFFSFPLADDFTFRCLPKKKMFALWILVFSNTYCVWFLANSNDGLNSLGLQYFLDHQGVLPVRFPWGPLEAKSGHRGSGYVVAPNSQWYYSPSHPVIDIATFPTCQYCQLAKLQGLLLCMP